MNDKLPSEQLERHYDRFKVDHARLKAELFNRLSDHGPQGARSAADVAVGLRRRRLALATSLPVAACLLIAAFAWIALGPVTATRVYGIEDLPERLREIRSIHVRGWGTYHHSDGKKTQRLKSPADYYVARPNRTWRNGSTFMDGRLVEVSLASDGERYMEIHHGKRQVTIGKEQPLRAEYFVEGFLQNQLIATLLGDVTELNYKKIRSERLDGVDADVYEHNRSLDEGRNRFRTVVWLGRHSGLPLKLQQYRQAADEAEYLMAEFHEIRTNVEPPEEMFAFEIPEGYTVNRVDRLEEEVGGSLSGATYFEEDGPKRFKFGVRFAFNVNDRAIFLCWAHINETVELPAPTEPELAGPLGRKLAITPVSSLGFREYANYLVRADKGSDFHWRWSLSIPQGPKRTIGRDQPYFEIRNDRGARLNCEVHPVRFNRERLAELMIETQRLTLPDDAPEDAVFTLEEIETLIERLAAPANE